MCACGIIHYRSGHTHRHTETDAQPQYYLCFPIIWFPLHTSALAICKLGWFVHTAMPQHGQMIEGEHGAMCKNILSTILAHSRTYLKMHLSRMLLLVGHTADLSVPAFFPGCVVYVYVHVNATASHQRIPQGGAKWKKRKNSVLLQSSLIIRNDDDVSAGRCECISALGLVFRYSCASASIYIYTHV